MKETLVLILVTSFTVEMYNTKSYYAPIFTKYTSLCSRRQKPATDVYWKRRHVEITLRYPRSLPMTIISLRQIQLNDTPKGYQ